MGVYLIYPNEDISKEDFDWIRVEIAETKEQALEQAFSFYICHENFQFYKEDLLHYHPESFYFELLKDDSGFLYDEDWIPRADLQKKSKEEMEAYERQCFLHQVAFFFEGKEALMEDYVDTTLHNVNHENGTIYEYSEPVYLFITKKYYYEMNQNFVLKKIS